MQRTYFIALISALVLLCIATYIHRVPTGDDAWFAEQSYWLLEDGVIRSEFFTGLNQWDKELLVSHKLFLWFGAGLMFLFGHELPVVQFTGLIPFVGIILLLVYYLRQRGETKGSPLLLALLLLVFSNRLLVKLSFQNRPEMLLAFLGFGAFLLLFTGKRHLGKVAGAGVLSGLSFVAHMNGIIYLIAGFATLALLKRYKEVLVFSVAGPLSAALYLVDILDNPNGLNLWIYQFVNDPAAANGIQATRKIIQMVTYPRMFLHSPEQFALTGLLIFILWRQRKFLSAIPAPLSIYTLTLFFSFWIITKSNSAMYMVLFIPFMTSIIYEIYRSRPFYDASLKVILGAYLTIGIVGMGQLIHKNWEFHELPEDYEALRKHLPEEGAGLVPLTFFFNEYEKYDQLLAHENYKLQNNKTDLSPDEMAEWADEREVDFILYDYHYLAEDYYPAPGQKELDEYYLTYFDGRFAVYEREED